MTSEVVKQIRKATRRRFPAEENIRMVQEGLQGEIPVTQLCHKHQLRNVSVRLPEDLADQVTP